MKINQKGISTLIEFEGFRAEAYLCPAGVATVGFGFTKNVRLGDKMTRSEAAERLKRELVEYEQGVLLACTNPPNENEFSAMVCFAFNVGVAGFKKSSVLKAHNRGDKQAAARAFGLWNKAGGKTLPGLTRRRMAEAALYLEPVAIDEVQMPQAIDPESAMHASSINRASAVAGGTATLAAVSETIQTVNQVKYGLEGLGQYLVPILLLVTICAVGYTVYTRIQQRKGGWA